MDTETKSGSESVPVSQEVKTLGSQGQGPLGLRMAPVGGLSTAGMKG